MSGLPFNKVAEIEDFEDPELAEVIREVCPHKSAVFGGDYPRGAEHRKDWETAMAVRALRHFGALRADATILGVAVGLEDTVFYLTRKVKQVFATDRYYDPGVWGPVAPGLMLVEPGEVAPFDFDVERLVVQHMDGRSLRYPLNTFDGIFSSGSIEHFGDLRDAAYAAYEMGRVLKPGGVLSLSTEFRLSGPEGGIGWPGRTLLFSLENLRRHIVEASGLRPVDELRPVVSQATLSTPRDLGAVITDRMGPRPPDAGPEFTHWDFPHMVLVQDGYVFTSVHLTLIKTDAYPEVPNDWAKPPRALLASISEYNRSVAVRPDSTPASEPAPAVRPVAGADAVELAEEAFAHLEGSPAQRLAGTSCYESAALSKVALADAVIQELDGVLLSVDADRDEIDAGLLELERLAARIDGQLADPHLTGIEPDNLPAVLASKVAIPGGPTFTVALDPQLPDAISRLLSAGKVADVHLLDLMLGMVRPDDRVLDLGAHVGTFCLSAAAAGCDVIAVEASPANGGLLRSSAWRNGFHRLYVVNAAVGDDAGVVPFRVDGPHGHVAWDDGTEETVHVPVVTVDGLVAEFGWPDVAFVKMDIEGYEPRALEGMKRLLSRPDAPPLLFESNGHTLAMAGSSPDALIAAVEACGYTVYLVDPGTLTRITRDDRQVQTVWDCLAVKRRPRGIDDWTIVASLTREQQVTRLLAEMRHPNPDCRAWVAGALASFPGSVRSGEGIAAALEQLRHDTDTRVSAAAAWSGSDREGTGQP